MFEQSRDPIKKFNGSHTPNVDRRSVGKQQVARGATVGFTHEQHTTLTYFGSGTLSGKLVMIFGFCHYRASRRYNVLSRLFRSALVVTLGACVCFLRKKYEEKRILLFLKKCRYYERFYKERRV